MDSTTKTTNLEFLLNFTKGDKEKLRRYISMFLTSTPQVINEMGEHLSIKNYDSLKLKAHSIKPQVQYMGATQMGEVLYQIEEICSQNKNDELLPNLLDKVKELNKRASSELAQFLSEL